MKLALIGLVAGFMSALFGVGGGLVVVPLLILLLAYTPHVATATSLAAIGDHRARRHDHVRDRRRGRPGLRAARRPARGRGATVGATLQQRVQARELSYLFAAFLFAIAVWLLV